MRGFSSVPVVAVKPNGDTAGVFDSMSEAARTIGDIGPDGLPDLSGIYRSIRNGRIHKGLMWYRKERHMELFFGGADMSFSRSDSRDALGRIRKGCSLSHKWKQKEKEARAEMAREMWKNGTFKNADFTATKKKRRRYKRLDDGKLFRNMEDIAEDEGVTRRTVQYNMERTGRINSHTYIKLVKSIIVDDI